MSFLMICLLLVVGTFVAIAALFLIPAVIAAFLQLLPYLIVLAILRWLF